LQSWQSLFGQFEVPVSMQLMEYLVWRIYTAEVSSE